MVRAALVQFSGHQSKEINIQKAEDLARQAAGNGARIICLPELSPTIYFCFDRDKKWFETAEPIPGPAVNRLAKVAKETGTVIVYPLYENDNGTLYNTAAVLGPDGNLIGRYRKMSIPQILRTLAPRPTATTSAPRSSSTPRATSWAARATSRTRSSTPTSTRRCATTRATSGASSSSGAPTPTARS